MGAGGIVVVVWGAGAGVVAVWGVVAGVAVVVAVVAVVVVDAVAVALRSEGLVMWQWDWRRGAPPGAFKMTCVGPAWETTERHESPTPQ